MTAKIKSAAKSVKRHHKNKPRGISSREFEKVHWPYLPLLAVIFLLLSICIQTGSLQAIVRNPQSNVLAYATSMSIGGLLSSTNSARTGNGVAALGLNAKLNAAAQAKANDMANRNYWSHDTPEGNPPWIFVTAQGYSYQKLGENLATGFSNEQATIDGWMASPGHRANMLDSLFTEVGFGYANNANYTAAGGGPMTIIVAFYGKPQGAAAPVPAPSPSSPVAATAPPAPKNTPPPTPAPIAATPPPPNPPIDKPADAPAPTQNEAQQNAPKEKEPVNTDNKNSGVALSFRTSMANVALAKSPLSSFATGVAIFGMFAAAGLWISKHALAIRRSLVRSEAYIFHHPLIDAGLIVTAGLCYLLTRTAGHII